MISWFRYVRKSERATYEARGWEYVCDCGPWSDLMKWTGEGEPE